MSSVSSMMAGVASTSPGKPVVSIISATKVNITWSEPFDNGRTPTTHYTLSIIKTSDNSVQQFEVFDSLYFEFDSSSGIIAGTVYQVSLKANNFITENFSSMTGADSSSTTFLTSVIPPEAPTLSSSSITRSRATVSWSLLASGQASGYSTTTLVYYLEADNGQGGNFYVISTNSTDTSKSITGITPGTTLRLRMRVQNVIGYLSYSNILYIQFAEVPAAPDAPTLVDRNGGSDGETSPFITMRWAVPSDNGDSPILGFKVEIAENFGSWTIGYDGGSNPTMLEWKFEELTAGSPYSFRVYARNNIGYSVASSSIQIYWGTVPFSFIVSPQLVLFTLNSNSADVQIQWDTLSTTLNGDSAILGYYIERDNRFGSSFVEPGTQIILPATLSNTFTGLTIGATYWFRVAAYNEIYTTDSLGSSLNYTPVLSVIMALVPSQVTTFYQDLSNLQTGTVELRWTAQNSNGSPILYYIVYKDDGLGIFYEIFRGLKTEFIDTLLTPGASYTYSIKVVNDAGSGIVSSSIVGIAGSLPSMPLNVRADVQSSTTLTIVWDAPSDTGSIPITVYLVESDNADLVYDSGTSTTSQIFSKTIITADIGKRFSFKVAAQNTLGQGQFAQDIQLVAADVPYQPSLSLIYRGLNWIYLKFTPCSSNGGSILTKYDLYMDQGVSGSPFSLIDEASPDQILSNVTNLISGNEYSFQLYYSNVVHTSTVYSTFFLVGVVPNNANDPKLVSSARSTATETTGEIKIAWTPNDDFPGLPITNYLLFIDNQGNGVFGSAVYHTGLTTLEYTFTGLTDEAEYGIKIQAENKIGSGDSSNIIKMIVAEVPSASSAPVMDSSTLKSISVAWSPPSDNGGRLITGYKIYMNNFFSDKFNLVYDGSFTPSVFSYTQQNLIPGQPYRFKESEINRVGEGSVSSSGTFYSAETPWAPSVPILISSTSTSVAFSWTTPIDDGDSVITGYEIWSKRITDPKSG